MHERMLDKSHEPTAQAICAHLDAESFARMQRLQSWLESRYALQTALCFPFGNGYGWGYKHSHKKQHLCHVFFERGAFTVTLQLGDKAVDAVEAALPALSPLTRHLWQSRYPCGQRGGWVHYRVLDDQSLGDIMALICLKRPPAVASGD